MTRVRQATFLLTWLILLFLAPAARAQDRDQQIYFLAIGQEHYLTPKGAGAVRFADIEGANDSAEVVAEELQKGGAVFGVVLQSTDTAAVTVANIDKALETVLARIAVDRPSHPLLVYYFAGHGLSEGLASLHYSIPGDLTYAGDVEALKREPDFAKHVIDTSWLETRIEKSKVPFLLLLDNCRSATAVQVSAASQGPLTDQAFRNVTDIIDALKFIGSFQGANPVLFSTAAGTDAMTVPNPDNNQLSLAPLARRFLLLSRDRAERHAAMSLGEFVWTMQSQNFDPHPDPEKSELSPVAVTRAKWGPTWDRTLLSESPSTGARIDHLKGTGTTPRFCCVAQKAGLPKTMTGSIVIAGFPGDWIAEGKRWSFSAPKTSIALLQMKEGTLSFGINPSEGSWTFEIAPPKGARLTLGYFAKVGCSGFQEASQLGLSLTAPGRSCNDVHGAVTITQVRYDAMGKVAALSGSAQHFCDDEAAPISISFDVASASAP